MAFETRELELACVCSLAVSTLSGAWAPPSSGGRHRLHRRDSAKSLDRGNGVRPRCSLSSRSDQCDVAAKLTWRPWSGVEFVECSIERAGFGSVTARQAVVDLDDFAGSLADVGEVDDDASVLFQVFVHALTRDRGRASSRHLVGGVAPLVSGRPWWWP